MAVFVLEEAMDETYVFSKEFDVQRRLDKKRFSPRV
jgi:hypothetical protein